MTSRNLWSMSRVRWQTVTIVVVGIAVLLRIVALDSDAFSGLSWSSALLTDEGFYIHNARNAVLYGTAHTDQFNNMLIMPALNAVQILVFRIFGVGAVQARMITVVASLATLPLFFIAVSRSLGRRTALTAAIFLALDHVYFLYNRLALMDSPAASMLIVMLFLWVQSQLSFGWRRSALLIGCGISLVLAYAIRGLAAPICIAPFAAAWIGTYTDTERGVPNQGARRFRSFVSLTNPLAIGLSTGILLYGALWYFPNRSELARVDHYYLLQLMPESLKRSVWNLIGSIFGDARGMTTYLFRHSSTVFMLAVAWMVTSLGETIRPISRQSELEFKDTPGKETPDDGVIVSDLGRGTLILAVVWLLVLWLVLAVTDYSPSRYYVLGYPAMAVIGAHALWNIPALVHAIVRRRAAAAFLIALVTYHITLVATEACFPVISNGPIAAASIAAVAVGAATLTFPHALVRGEIAIRCRIPQTICAAVGVWTAINAGWICLWLGHLTFRQRSADRWLSEHLPSNSVLFGAVAPGLCMNNHFRVVNVIQDLCNDNQPLEKFGLGPQYVLILDDDWRETWWDRSYPFLLSRDRRIKTFPHILRPRFLIGVYRVPETN